MAVSYVAAPQANIYFGGILIDECYDIQYSYRESKEPIYGYLSTHFDAIIKGTVIITGALTINYKHDQYLSKVLDKAGMPISVKSKNARPNTLKQHQKEYKEKLVAYAEALKTQAELKKEMAAEMLQRDAAINKYNAKRGVYETPLQILESEAAAIRAKSERSESESDRLIKLEWILIPEAEKKRDVYLNNTNNTEVIEAYTDRIKIVEENLKALDLSGLRNSINDMKNKVESLMVTSRDLPVLKNEETSQSLHSTRAEDYRKGFTIEFNYNGSPHKRILNCELLGHGHVITQSGMPVKEQYTFIGKRME